MLPVPPRENVTGRRMTQTHMWLPLRDSKKETENFPGKIIGHFPAWLRLSGRPDTERGCVMIHRHYWLIAAVPNGQSHMHTFVNVVSLFDESALYAASPSSYV